ncbi:aldose 1-epimerase family protein [uncultured Sulfitobacter sp.]|uniref:aldose 1-epimerase family protein n=1 Tax=uncultured Sulfitobacter sp. TaxID=191468 RepID=UPI0026397D6D|nr:aldose 1-epimerase family protein [uncultured Sulfitobacter sp.]
MTDMASTLGNDHLSLTVAALGAEMQFLRTTSGADLLWKGDVAFWSGRAPILFPIVGRAVDDIIAVENHTAPMPQHGFARRSSFSLAEQTDVMCRHTLMDTEQTRAVYPFSFRLDVVHQLDGNTLRVRVEVRNEGGTSMPFGFGFHPAFSWPLPGAAGQMHHVTLAQGGSPKRVAIEDGLLRPQPVKGPFINGDLLIEEALFTDGAVVFPNGSDALRYGPQNGPSLSFEFNNLPDLALWRPKDAPFLCIEPWHGTASYLGDGPQISKRPNTTTLEAGKTATFGYAVTVDL